MYVIYGECQYILNSGRVGVCFPKNLINMNPSLFIYRREAIVPPPYPKDLNSMFERALRLVVAIVGAHDAFVSGLHLGERKVATYHKDYFHPREALIGNTAVPIEYSVRKREDHRVYQLAVPPDNSLVGVSDRAELDDFVFQVGVRHRTPGMVSVGVVEALSKYVDKPEQVMIDTNAESGSGVFDRSGRLIGMILGIVAPNIMAAIPIVDLFALNIGPEA